MDVFADGVLLVSVFNIGHTRFLKNIVTNSSNVTISWYNEKLNCNSSSSFNDSCNINFFKGALLKDPGSILEKPGESSQSARYLRITSVSQIKELESVIKSYITEAIELERSGAKVEFKKNPEPIPEELLVKFEENPDLHSAFLALTPGRQRGYILFFSAPKQSKTRESRIEKCIPQIMNGKGIND